MGVRLKILGIISLVAIGLVGILYLAFSAIMSASIRNVEQTSTQRAVARVLGALHDDAAQLGISAADWGPWDDTYQFIQDSNAAYITSNLGTNATFVNLHAGLMLFVDPAGQVVWGKRIDLASGADLPLPPNLGPALKANHLLDETDPHGVLTGLLVLPEGTLLVAAAPIVTTDYQGPIRGAVVLGRFVDAAELAALSARTQLPIHSYALNQPLPAEAVQARAALTGVGAVFVSPLDDQTVAGYALAAGLDGQPALLLRVDNPRDAQAQAQASTRYFLAALAASALVFGLATLILIDRTVVRRLDRLNASVTHIGVQADAAARVAVDGGDEIATLARGVNGMLAALEQAQTKNREAEAALRTSEQRYALAAEGANDGLWDWDLAQDTIHYSDRWKEMAGGRPSEIGSQPSEWFSRLHPQDLPGLKAAIAAHLAWQTEHLDVEHRLRQADGTYRWVRCRGLAVRGADGEPARMAGSLTDIDEQKQAEQRLVYDAMHDALTGLANRALLLDRLGQALERVRRIPTRVFAVLFLDLDRFKLVNDSLGHLAGDEMLVEVGRRLRTCARPQDTVARLGGDEFALLVEDVDPLAAGGHVAAASHVAGRIQAALARAFTLRGQEVFTSASIGIAGYRVGYQFPEELLRDADIAMYQAKTLGRARHVLFDAADHPRASIQLQLETDLRYALERDELRLYFQPLVSLADRQIIGCEALVRWQHPTLGLLAPLDFIPLAEETGLIVPLGRWVMDAACRQASQWPAARRLGIHVNLSTKQFASARLVEDVLAGLAQWGLAAERLTLEMTESAIVEGSTLAETALARLSELGVTFALDDFGTGYSGLDTLRRFKINLIKIDRLFVANLSSGESDEAIVQSVLNLGRQLGMRVVAAGIETQAQHDRLLALGCELGQGFLYSPPVPPEQLERLLAGAAAVTSQT